MSELVERVKETFSSDARLKKRAKKALDIADKIIVEMQAQRVNIKKCAELQGGMLNNLQKVMDGALKLGDKSLYMQSGKLVEVVAEWHKITNDMSNDEGVMIQFVSMIKTFYTAVLEYKQVVQDFGKTTKDFVSLKQFGLGIPKQIEIKSRDAAVSFRELANSMTSIKMSYTGLTDYVSVDDEDKWSKRFEEERQRLMEKNLKGKNDVTRS